MIPFYTLSNYLCNRIAMSSLCLILFTENREHLIRSSSFVENSFIYLDIIWFDFQFYFRSQFLFLSLLLGIFELLFQHLKCSIPLLWFSCKFYSNFLFFLPLFLITIPISKFNLIVHFEILIFIYLCFEILVKY